MSSANGFGGANSHVGGVGEEAAKLIEALGDWARNAGLHGGQGEAISDGSPACRLCPVCQVIAVLRHAKPETFAHLLEASAAMTAALRSIVESTDAGAGRDRRGGVEKINLDPQRGPVAPDSEPAQA